jgi:hypothetical protein
MINDIFSSFGVFFGAVIVFLGGVLAILWAVLPYMIYKMKHQQDAMLTELKLIKSVLKNNLLYPKNNPNHQPRQKTPLNHSLASQNIPIDLIFY